ncbi:hypothetical protein PB1_12299 [Bacillus methanolicus PB1]|uniref:Uncharacterized protein n=1 Tax=Bacillus methanolicus PB1 TaxID=997296 RepID=I3DVR9_BACMT|nr:hypothetical protein PB1_12299 [Bacillus methanolicus PB1]
MNYGIVGKWFFEFVQALRPAQLIAKYYFFRFHKHFTFFEFSIRNQFLFLLLYF